MLNILMFITRGVRINMTHYRAVSLFFLTALSFCLVQRSEAQPVSVPCPSFTSNDACALAEASLVAVGRTAIIAWKLKDHWNRTQRDPVRDDAFRKQQLEVKKKVFDSKIAEHKQAQENIFHAVLYARRYDYLKQDYPRITTSMPHFDLAKSSSDWEQEAQRKYEMAAKEVRLARYKDFIRNHPFDVEEEFKTDMQVCDSTNLSIVFTRFSEEILKTGPLSWLLSFVIKDGYRIKIPWQSDLLDAAGKKMDRIDADIQQRYGSEVMNYFYTGQIVDDRGMRPVPTSWFGRFTDFFSCNKKA